MQFIYQIQKVKHITKLINFTKNVKPYKKFKKIYFSFPDYSLT